MVSGEEFTKSGAMKRPGLSLVVQWVKEAWESISKNIIIKSFKKCGTGISNAMDGTEDDILYEDLMASSTALADHIDPQDETNDDDELNDYYDYGFDDLVSDEQLRQLFESDNETQEFGGFESD